MVDPKAGPSEGGSGATKGASSRSGAGMLAAGAARASGERAKRSRTPLLTDPAGDDKAPRPALRSVDGARAKESHTWAISARVIGWR